MDGSLMCLIAFIVLGGLILVAFGFAWARPHQFLAVHRRLPPFVVIVAYVLAFFVISTPIMFGLIEFLEPLPYDWGSVDEDGDFVPLGESIASIVSFALGVWILSVTYGWVSERVMAEDLLDEVRLTRAMLEEPHYLDGIIKRWERELEWADRESDKFRRRSRLLETARKWQDHIERQKESAAFYATERLKTPPPKPPPVRWTVELMERACRASIAFVAPKLIADAADLDVGELGAIEPKRAADLLQRMRDQAASLLRVDEDLIARGRGEPIDLTHMIAGLPGVTLEDGAKFVATYSGDSHGGHHDITTTLNGAEVGLLAPIQFADTIEGAASAFFLYSELETFGVYWHGSYGRDHKTLLEWRELTSFATEHHWQAPAAPQQAAFTLGSVPDGAMDSGAGCVALDARGVNVFMTDFNTGAIYLNDNTHQLAIRSQDVSQGGEFNDLGGRISVRIALTGPMAEVQHELSSAPANLTLVIDGAETVVPVTYQCGS